MFSVTRHQEAAFLRPHRRRGAAQRIEHRRSVGVSAMRADKCCGVRVGVLRRPALLPAALAWCWSAHRAPAIGRRRRHARALGAAVSASAGHGAGPAAGCASVVLASASSTGIGRRRRHTRAPGAAGSTPAGRRPTLLQAAPAWCWSAYRAPATGRSQLHANDQNLMH